MQLETMGQTLLSTIKMAEEVGDRRLLEAAIEVARVTVVDVPMAVMEPDIIRVATWRSPLVPESPLEKLVRSSILKAANARNGPMRHSEKSGLVKAPSAGGE